VFLSDICRTYTRDFGGDVVKSLVILDDASVELGQGAFLVGNLPRLLSNLSVTSSHLSTGATQLLPHQIKLSVLCTAVTHCLRRDRRSWNRCNHKTTL